MRKTMKEQEMVDVIKAYMDGKKIEYKCKDVVSNSFWLEISDPTWNFNEYDYRIRKDIYEKMIKNNIKIENDIDNLDFLLQLFARGLIAKETVNEHIKKMPQLTRSDYLHLFDMRVIDSKELLEIFGIKQ